MVRRTILGFALCFVLLFAALGPAGSPSVRASAVQAPRMSQMAAHPAGFLDKTRVVLHLAVAYGVFHHWVYQPFRAGQISIHHPIKLVKAGLALLFAVHEMRKAYDIAKGSSSPTLHKLSGALSGSISKFQSVGVMLHKPSSSLTDGTVASSVNDLNSQVNHSNSIMSVPDAPVGQLGSASTYS